MAEFLVDSYNESNYDAISSLYNGGATALGNSFTASKSGRISSCKFYLRKTGSPTGNATAVLYAHTGTYGTSSVPTGSALATSGNFDVSTLTTDFQLITFSFSTGYVLNKGTYYCQVCNYDGGNVSNALQIGRDDSSPTHSGNTMYYQGGWNALSGVDTVFYVYATLISGGFSGFSPWIFMKDMWKEHNKIFRPKGILLPKEGFSY